MDDDGLLLNFAAPAAAGPSRPRAAKGTPHQRAQAQRAARASQSGAAAAQPRADASSSATAAAAPAQRRAPTAAAPSAAPAAPAPPRPRQSGAGTHEARSTPRAQHAASSAQAEAAAVAQAIEAAQAKGRHKPAKAAAAKASGSGSGTGSAGASTAPARPPPAGVISSLFTGAASAAPVKATPAAPAAQPTNAPLDTSSFASIGLDALLVAHLAGRMGIGSAPTSIQRAALPLLMAPCARGAQRDVLIHAQTGSGKTLAYLLPILQSLLPLCTDAASWIDRSVGTLAIILAPTRELARQIYEVAEKLVQLHLSPRQREAIAAAEEAAQKQDEEASDEEETPRRTRWLVPGLLSGGSTRNHEKSKLRKGLPIIVATPGRLLDHLQNTTSLDAGKLQWLVLDEADRLLEMGFRETLDGILKALEGRRRMSKETAREAMREKGAEETDETADGMGIEWWKHPRRTVLCSATLDENVQVLAGSALVQPVVVRALPEEDRKQQQQQARARDAEAEAQPAVTGEKDVKLKAASPSEAPVVARTNLAAPAQLRQHFVVVPTKQRLVVLLALLRQAVSRSSDSSPKARRVIVFISCTDAVDFFWRAMGGAKMSDAEEPKEDGSGEEKQAVAQSCEVIPSAPIFRLHGSMTQSERIASLRAFSKAAPEAGGAAILLCTSVAARGLDLPDVSCVVQLDAPTEGGVDEYLHRVGRTARVGREGQSWIMLLPHEREAATRLERAMSGQQDGTPRLHEVDARQVLRHGFGGGAAEYEARATDAQLAFERWVLRSDEVSSCVSLRFHHAPASSRLISSPPSRHRAWHGEHTSLTFAPTPRIRPPRRISSPSLRSSLAIWPRRLPCAKLRRPSRPMREPQAAAQASRATGTRSARLRLMPTKSGAPGARRNAWLPSHTRLRRARSTTPRTMTVWRPSLRMRPSVRQKRQAARTRRTRRTPRRECTPRSERWAARRAREACWPLMEQTSSRSAELA
jgi:ATP-dependent RNA helicase DDX31/DBP7